MGAAVRHDHPGGGAGRDEDRSLCFADDGRGGNPGRREALTRDARARMAAQLADTEKMGRCEYVIDNSGSIMETRAAVKRIYGELARAAE